MLKLYTLLTSVVALSYGAIYPHTTSVRYDPTTFNLLYDASTGPFNETWYFARTCNLTNLIVPSQKSFTAEPSTYIENITIAIRRNYNKVITLVAEGKYQGNVSYGTNININIFNSTDGHSYPQMIQYNYYSSSIFVSYLIEVTFNVPGIYVWHSKRDMSYTYILQSSTNSDGYITGLSYS